MNPRLPFSRLIAAVLTLTFVVAPSLSSVDSALATTPTPLENGQNTLFFIGDSLTVGTKAFGKLQERIEQTGIWKRVVINAKVGRRTDQSISILQRTMPVETTTIVVALGTNDVISRREPKYPIWVINEVMKSSRGLPVLWFNTDFSPTGRGDWRSRSRRFNRALRDAQGQWKNLVIADWYNFFTPKGKTRFQDDGVHLSVSGYKLRAVYSESQIRKFGETVVNASTTTSTIAESTTTAATQPTVAPTTPTSTIVPTTTEPSTTTSSTTSTTTTTTAAPAPPP